MRRRGSAMVGMLAAVAIVMVLIVVLFFGSGAFGGPGGKAATPERADKKGRTIPGRVMYGAKDDVCRSNLQQVRYGVEVFKTSSAESQPPEKLEETRLGSSFYACPIDPHEPYEYDPQTGQVHCSHPGHEKY